MRNIFRSLVALSVATVLAGCSVGGVYPPKSGQVLDWGTKEPIPDTIVVATWHGGVPAVVEQQHRCYHVESATTDERGRFRIPFHAEGPKLLIDTYRQYSAYKAGYRVAIDERRRHRSNYDRDGVLYLERDLRSRKTRLEQLLPLFDSYRCPDAGGSKRNFHALYLEFAKTAELLAETKEGLELAKGFRKRAENLLNVADEQ